MTKNQLKLYKNKYRIESARLQGYDYSSAGEYFVTICTKGMVEWFGRVDAGEMKLNDTGKIVADEWIRTPTIRPNVELDAWVVMPNHVHGIVVLKSLVETHCSASLQCPTTPSQQQHPTTPSQQQRPTAPSQQQHPTAPSQQQRPTTPSQQQHPTTPSQRQRPTTPSQRQRPTTPPQPQHHQNIFGPQRMNLASIIRGFKSATTKRIHEIGLWDFVWEPRYHDHIIRNDRELHAIQHYIRNNPGQWDEGKNHEASVRVWME